MAIEQITTCGGHPHVTAPQISKMIRDPALREAFRRAERDPFDPVTVPAPRPMPTLRGGAVAQKEMEHV